MLCVIGVCLVGTVATGLFFQYALPSGSGPAGPEVSRELFSRQWTSRPVWFVGLGDSVTAGFGARKGYSYFDRLVKDPPDEFRGMNGISLSAVLPNLAFTNLSISGSTSDEVLTRQLTHLPTNGLAVYGVIVITTGGNDIIHNYGRTAPREEAMYGATLEEAQAWIQNFAQRMDEIVMAIKNRFPGGCDIFVANIFDPTDAVGDAERAGLPHWADGMRILEAYNTAIQNCAAKNPNVHLINMHDAFLGHGIHCTQFWQKHFDLHDPHYWYYINLEDPNERGYDVIRRLFLQQIATVRDHIGN